MPVKFNFIYLILKEKIREWKYFGLDCVSGREWHEIC